LGIRVSRTPESSKGNAKVKIHWIEKFFISLEGSGNLEFA
jgi:hypothetical protein